MRNQSLRRFINDELLSCLTDSQGIGLGEEIRHQLIVIADWVVGDCEWLL